MILCSNFRFFSIRVDLWVSMMERIAFWVFCMIFDEILRVYWRSDVILLPVVFLENICRFVEVCQRWANQNTGSVICRKQHTVFAKTSIFWFTVNKPWVCSLPRSLKWPHFIVKLCFRENISSPRLENESVECISLRQLEIEWMSYSSEVWTSLRCLNSLHCQIFSENFLHLSNSEDIVLFTFHLNI